MPILLCEQNARAQSCTQVDSQHEDTDEESDDDNGHDDNDPPSRFLSKTKLSFETSSKIGDVDIAPEI